MKLFGRKKSKEEEIEDEDEEKLVVKKKLPKDKDFKDLNSQNSRRRKEPVKPWGKGERILVLSTIILTVGASAFLSLSSRNWKLPGLPRIQRPSISFIEEKRPARVDTKEAKTAESIQYSFDVKTRNLTGVYAFQIVHLDSGYTFGKEEDEEMQAASLIKLPVMAAFIAESEKGNLNLDSIYELRNLDKVGGAGSLAAKPAGYELTYREIIELMGKQSDNTAFNIARRILGDELISVYTTRFGMINTSFQENITTPRDIGTFFRKLWRGEIMSEDGRDEMLAFLTDTSYENWIAAGVPEGIRVAHKYGREVHVINDAGIIFIDKPYVLVIMSEGVVDSEADKIIPDIARSIYEIEVSSGN